MCIGALTQSSTAGSDCIRRPENQTIADHGAKPARRRAGTRNRRRNDAAHAASESLRAHQAIASSMTGPERMCPDSDVLARLEQSLPGARRGLRLHGQAVEGAAVDLDLLGLLQVQRAREVLDVHDVGQLLLAETKQRERALRAIAR